MENVVWILPALICPIGMGLMMWMMARGRAEPKKPSAGDLREEQGRIEAEPAQLEKRDAVRAGS